MYGASPPPGRPTTVLTISARTFPGRPTLTPSPLGLQLAAGAATQVALLGLLASAVGLGPAGWLTGLAHAACVWLLLDRAVHRTVRRAGRGVLGPADLVTLARTALVGAVAALVVDGLLRGGPSGAALLAMMVLVSLSLLLDGVDGQVARRTGTVSPLGARFDMEADAFAVLVLSVHVATVVGGWAVAIGAMRYAFVAAGWLLPWLRAPLPTRVSAKAVAVVQGIVLLVAAAEVLPQRVAAAAVGLALALLVWSFGHSVRWLWQHRDTPAVAGC